MYGPGLRNWLMRFGQSELCRAGSQLGTQVRGYVAALRQNCFFWDFSLSSENLHLVGRGPPTLWKVICFTQILTISEKHLHSNTWTCVRTTLGHRSPAKLTRAMNHHGQGTLLRGGVVYLGVVGLSERESEKHGRGAERLFRRGREVRSVLMSRLSPRAAWTPPRYGLSVAFHAFIVANW